MMPRRIEWTPSADATIVRMRAAGASWDIIAATLHHDRWTIIERGKKIGAVAPPPPPDEPEIDLGREPLPSGHPDTWGAIIAGTCLAGARYPHPVFV